MVPVSIGQGYNTYTPMQLAHALASLVNNGAVYRPHLVKEMLDYNKQQITLIEPKPDHQMPFKPEHFEYIKQAMRKVVGPGGTARAIGGAPYTLGGKTGTAQVVQIKQGQSYNAAALREQHRDHAWFIGFAPVEKPKIAVALILENGGWGATAAPLVRQLMDYHLLTLQGGGNTTMQVEQGTPDSNPILESEKHITPLLPASGFQTGIPQASGVSAP